MKPCVCGTKDEPTYWNWAGNLGIECQNCKRAVIAHNEVEALRMWNAAMSQEKP